MKQLSLLTLLLVLIGCVSPEERQQYQESNKNAQKGVIEWIKKHALYPASYESISFSEFSQSHSSRSGEKIPGSENYLIKHTHKTLDKDSNLMTFSGYFILENDFDVNIIEVNRSNSFGGAFPPKTEIWMSQFGRALNADDSLELEKLNNEKLKELVKSMKEGLESGDLKTDNPEVLENLINDLDTINK